MRTYDKAARNLWRIGGLLFFACIGGAGLFWGARGFVWHFPPEPTFVQTSEVIAPGDAFLERMLRAQGLSMEKLGAWGRKYRAWGLLRLPLMDARAQRQVALVATYIQRQNSGLPPDVLWREAAAFVHYAAKYDAPLDLAVAVGHVESHFNPRARSPYGAAGVMQVMWRIHDDLLRANGVTSSSALYDPDLGVAGGVLLLSRYLRATGNEEEALRRYLGAFVKAYIRKVHRYKRNIHRILGSSEA